MTARAAARSAERGRKTGGEATAGPETGGACDEQLLQDALAGDGSAVEQLVSRYERPLYRMLLGMTGRSAVAEDLVQDTFLRLIRQRAPLDHVGGWLYRCAANLAIDHARRRRREQLVAEPPEAPSAGPDWTDRILDRERLAAALNQLPADQRQVVALHYFADQSLADVARALALPLGTVKTRLHRAYRRLAAVLAPEAAPRREDDPHAPL